ncbi:MAG: hypothetical protein H6681_02950 [Desulfobacteraceae bacterium]|nr:hypothetical protein [Desulfobacteraceae bacterium]
MNKILLQIFDFFKANLREIAVIVAITELPLIVIDNLFIKYEQNNINFLIVILGIIIIAVSNAAMTVLFSSILNKDPFDVKKILSAGLSYLPKMITAVLLYGLLIILGVFFFILPGLIIGARLSLYNYYIIYENMEPVDALKESFNATKGATFEVTTIFVVIFLIATLPYVLFANYLNILNIFNPFVLMLTDYVFSVIGTLVLVLTFRLYCMVKEENGIKFD